MREEIYHLHRFPSVLGQFQGALSGRSWCDGSYHVQRKNDGVWIFEIIVKGKGRLRIGDQHYQPRAGDVYIVPAYSDHEYFSDDKDPWEKVWLNAKGSLISALLKEYGLSGIHLIHQAGKALQKFEKIVELSRNDPVEAQSELPLLFHSLLLTLAESHVERKAKPKSQSQVTAENIKHYLDVHLVEDVSLDELSRQFQKSPSQVIRCFKKVWGTTPKQYVLDQRIDEAKWMFQRSMSSIKVIAVELGFLDEFHFSSTFKKKTGMAPGVYRSQNRLGG